MLRALYLHFTFKSGYKHVVGKILGLEETVAVTHHFEVTGRKIADIAEPVEICRIQRGAGKGHTKPFVKNFSALNGQEIKPYFLVEAPDRGIIESRKPVCRADEQATEALHLCEKLINLRCFPGVLCDFAGI